MLLGTFREFAGMRQASTNSGPMLYYFYWGAYMIIFRYVLINMFFAILMRNFKDEDTAMEDRLKVKGESTTPKKFNPLASFRKFLGGISKSLRRNKSSSEESEPSAELAPEVSALTPTGSAGALVAVTVDDEVAAIDMGKAPAAASSVVAESTPSAGAKRSISFKEITADTVEKATTWKYLPQPMKDWAVSKAQELSTMIEKKSQDRTELEARKDEYELDRIMQETENEILEKRKEMGEAAETTKRDLEEEELASLKVIHRDQESLAWYIMKREAELKKLEDEKQLKQERYDKMVKAAQSLISADQQEDPASSGMLALPPNR